MENTSRPFEATPSDQFQALMASLDEWIKAEGERTWDEAEEIVAAAFRAARYADGCDQCPTADNLTYPHKLAPNGTAGWTASYLCPRCANSYDVGWADDLTVLGG